MIGKYLNNFFIRPPLLRRRRHRNDKIIIINFLHKLPLRSRLHFHEYFHCEIIITQVQTFLCHCQEVSIIDCRSCRGCQPNSLWILVLSATSLAGSPARRSATLIGIICPVISIIASTTSRTECPLPVPTLYT